MISWNNGLYYQNGDTVTPFYYNNIGDLHVWRKTVKNEADIPAGYTLGVAKEVELIKGKNNSGSALDYRTITVSYSTSITVNDNGKIITLVSPSTATLRPDYPAEADVLKGKFFKVTQHQSTYVDVPSGINFVPSSATFDRVYPNSNGWTSLTCSAMQTVTGYAKVTAGTTIDYPVSTNPNAYQTGSDEKPAGYTLGEVQSGLYKFTTSSDNYIIAGDGVNVSQDGSVSLSNNTIYSKQSTYVGDSGAQTLQSAIVGKFFYLQNSESEEFSTKQIYYVPSNATVTWNSSSGGFTELSKYQTVTGYPAIPAGITIEYMGQLGDKGSVGSYVGTGTKGSANPNKIKFDRRPDVVFVQPSGNGNRIASFMCIVVAGLTNSTSNWNALSFAKGSGSSVNVSGYEIYASYDDAANELSWFCASTREAGWQQNVSGITYNYVAK